MSVAMRCGLFVAAEAAAMQASANVAPSGASSFDCDSLSMPAGAELVDDFLPLGVGEFEFREISQDRLGQLGTAEVDEQEDRLDVVGRFLARHFEARRGRRDSSRAWGRYRRGRLHLLWRRP